MGKGGSTSGGLPPGSSSGKGGKKQHQGGWSEKEGAWRKNPDVHQVKSPFCSASALGEGVYGQLKPQLEAEFGVKIRLRARDSTAGRAHARKHGGLVSQLSIIGRGGMDVYKIFLRAAKAANADLPPDLPHLRKPVVQDDVEPTTPDPKPPHPDPAAQRTSRAPPASQDKGGGLPPLGKGPDAPEPSAAPPEPGPSVGPPEPEPSAEPPEPEPSAAPKKKQKKQPDFTDWSSSDEEVDESIEKPEDEPGEKGNRADIPTDMELVVLPKVCVDAGQACGYGAYSQQVVSNRNTIKKPDGVSLDFKVAFCVTSVGRNHQVVRALPMQLMTLWPWRPHVRLYLVDFNKDETLLKWVGANCFEAAQAGLLHYARCAARSSWHASICKNACHFWASSWADVLVNLDGDRIISEDLPPHIFQYLNPKASDKHRVHQYSNNYDTGTYGTIAIPTALFNLMNGYNELFLPCGFQDAELLQRCRKAGAMVQTVSARNIVGSSLPNDPGGSWALQARVKNNMVSVADIPEGRLLKFGNMDMQNRAMAQEHIRLYGETVRNQSPSWQPLAVEPVDLEAYRPDHVPLPKEQVQHAHPAAGADVLRAMVVTFGTKVLHASFPHLQSAQRLRGLSRPTTDLVLEVTDHMGWRLDFYMDATHYFQPLRDDLRVHLGHHVSHMRRLLPRKAALDFLHDHISTRCTELVSRGSRSMTIGIFDDDGCYDCVCLAWVVMQILRRLNHVVLDPQHTARMTRWPFVACQMQGCSECHADRMDEARQEVLSYLPAG